MAIQTIQEIEQVITQLSAAQLADFRAWFAEFEAKNQDEQFAADIAAGRLNALADEALRDFTAASAAKKTAPRTPR